MIKQPTFVEPMPCRPIAPAETPRCLALEGPLVKIKGRSPKPMFFFLYPIYIYILYPVGGLGKYESQWEGLSHILWKIKMFETTNQLYIYIYDVYSRDVPWEFFLNYFSLKLM